MASLHSLGTNFRIAASNYRTLRRSLGLTFERRAIMAKPTQAADSLGYPDRTFETEILPCEAVSSIRFKEAGPSRYGEGKEPLRRAVPIIESSITRQNLDTAAAHLRSGQLVSFPSETVYGLGANALLQEAAAKIYAAKKRPADNPLIVHVADLEMLDELLPPSFETPQAYHALMKRFWPGPLTLLFPVDLKNPKVPSVVTCGHPSVAIRMPSHPIARALIACSRLPMAGPSANASGRPSPTTAAHVMRDLGGHLDQPPAPNADRKEPRGRLKYILDGGPCDVGLESTVVDGITAKDELRILRPGGVSVEQIGKALNEEGLGGQIKLRVYGKDMERSTEQESNPTTPGMKYRHYSPTAKVIMLLPSRLFSRALESHAASSSAGNVIESLPASSAQEVPKTFADIVRQQLSPNFNNGRRLARVGVMASSNSDLAKWIHSASKPTGDLQDHLHRNLSQPLTLEGLDDAVIHPFDLGPTERADIYAQRMFDGLRTLDEGPLHGADRCDLIFVEALDDDGVGLAVMNRLKKASSSTVVVDC